MEPISATIAAIATLLITKTAEKTLEKTSEKLSEGLVKKMGAAIETIRHYDPKLLIEDKQVMKIGKARLEKITAEPTVEEFLKAADAEPNKAFQAKLADDKAKIVAVMIEKIDVEEHLDGQSLEQNIARTGSESVDATLMKNVKAKSMDLRGSRQTIK